MYVVAGSSGKLGGGLLNHPAMFVSLNQLGSMVLEIADDRLDAVFVRSTGAVTDEFTILKDSRCPADLDDNGAVDFQDVIALITAWGQSGGREDLDESGTVDFPDLVIVLANWGPCGGR